MSDVNNRLLLVGDNPFLNISHLSQKKARERLEVSGSAKYSAGLLRLALENGANGFTFSACDSNFEILRNLDLQGLEYGLGLYPILPYAYEYVQMATQRGGFSGLVKNLGWEMIKSRNFESLIYGALTPLTANPEKLLKAYLCYELARLKKCTNDKKSLQSVLLHQVVTDLALALDLEWLFDIYTNFFFRRNVIPGFNTGNFPYLVKKFKEWNIDLSKVLIAAPFNKVGFQVVPSIEECEKTLGLLPKPNVIAISVLAAGYIDPKEAFDYIVALPNLKGVAIGVSNKNQASQTFTYLKRKFVENSEIIINNPELAAEII